MTTKDFKVGQVAFMTDDERYKSLGIFTEVKEVQVVKAGRKYVTVKEGGHQDIQFFEPVNCTFCLIEDKDDGTPRLLFSTREMLNNYREREELKSWLSEAKSWLKIESYTLDQLRAVKKILEEGDGE